MLEERMVDTAENELKRLLKQEVFARSLRTSSVVCFGFLIVSSNEYFKSMPAGFYKFWEVLPAPILTSLTISLFLALGAQAWLRKIRSAKKKFDS